MKTMTVPNSISIAFIIALYMFAYRDIDQFFISIGLADGGLKFIVYLVVVTLGFFIFTISNLVSEEIYEFLYKKLTKNNLSGKWSFRLEGDDGVVRYTSIDIEHTPYKIEVEGKNSDDPFHNINITVWQSAYAWIADKQLFIAYRFKQGAADKVIKEGMLKITLSKGEKRYFGNYYDYFPKNNSGKLTMLPTKIAQEIFKGFNS